MWINVLAAVGTLHVVSSVKASVESEMRTVESEQWSQNLEVVKELEHAWYQRLTKEKEKQEWIEKNVKWESSKSNPLEPYVDDQSSTLTTLSNAAFVIGGLMSMLPLAGVPILPLIRRRNGIAARRKKSLLKLRPHFKLKRLPINNAIPIYGGTRKRIKGFRKARKIPSQRQRIRKSRVPSQFRHTTSHQNLILSRNRHRGAKRGQNKLNQQSLRSTFPASTSSYVPEVLDTLGSPAAQRTNNASPFSPRQNPSGTVRTSRRHQSSAKTPIMLTTNTGMNSLPPKSNFGDKLQEPGLDSYFSPKAPAINSAVNISDRRSSEGSTTLMEMVRSSSPNRRLNTLNKEFWSQLPLFLKKFVGQDSELELPLDLPGNSGQTQNHADSFSRSVEK